MAISKVSGTAWADIAKVNDVNAASIASISDIDAPVPARIDTADLIYYYEPANTNSYSGSGTDFNSVFTTATKTLTLSGGPVHNSNGWFTYDGVNDQARGTNAFTISNVVHTVIAWANPNSLPATQYFILDNQLYSGRGHAVVSIAMGNYNGVGPEFRFAFRHSTGVVLTSNTRIQGSKYVSIGNWAFAAARYYSNGDIKVAAYNRTTQSLDYKTETAYSPSTNSVSNPITAIGSATYNAAYFPGKIGEVICYDKVLTDTEIQTIFNDTKARYGY